MESVVGQSVDFVLSVLFDIFTLLDYSHSSTSILLFLFFIKKSPKTLKTKKTECVRSEGGKEQQRFHDCNREYI